jgi:chromatin remodeling complex protein RSC6
MCAHGQRSNGWDCRQASSLAQWACQGWTAKRKSSKRYAAPVYKTRVFPLAKTDAQTNNAFMKSLKPSPELAAIIGADLLPRTEVTKRLWDYIKQHNLQNPANKRNILCDNTLKAVMGKDEVTMFEMTGLVGKHLA